jgi:hypothetical protein
VIWLNAPVLFALAALAAPVLIHILVQRRAEQLPFPTLRFLQPARLAAIRRHVLEDAALLAVRAAILALAVAALAGPLLLTAVRRQAWERRVARAVVTETMAADGQPSADDGVFRSQRFTGPSLRDSVRRATAWLEQTPPARRELIIASPLAIGSLDAADVALIPASIGIRFERQRALPQTRTVPAGRLIGVEPFVLAREVTFAGASTIVRDVPTSEAATWPIEVTHAPDAKAAVDAAKSVVLGQRVRASTPDRRVRLVIGATAVRGPAVENATPVTQPWMADAAARIVRDAELQTAASRVANGLADDWFSKAPWQTLASAADGHPLLVAADRLVVSAAAATDIVTPLLMRAIANGVVPAADLQSAEVLPIADRQLQEWSRPASIPVAPNAKALKRSDSDDDRRWFWIAALGLIALETWMRGARMSVSDQQHQPEDKRVA